MADEAKAWWEANAREFQAYAQLVDPTDPKNQLWGQTPPFLETFPTVLIFKSRK